jgi:molecular chaperone GrpE
VRRSTKPTPPPTRRATGRAAQRPTTPRPWPPSATSTCPTSSVSRPSSRTTASEQQEAARGAVTRLLLDLLPVVDDLDRAIALGAQSEIDVDQFRAGLDLVKRNLGDVLGRHGVEEVDALGHPFDPHRHEALMMRPVTGDDEGRQGEVIEVFQPGFTLNGRVVRPARVVVAGEV